MSSETKLKMDLFSALGEAKRELSIVNSKYLKILKFGVFIGSHDFLLYFLASVSSKDKEIFDLKAKIADVLAVMPGGVPGGVLTTSNAAVGSGRGNSVYTSSTLSLDLPASTDLSFTGKMSSLGLSDLEDKLTSSGIYSAAAQLANSPVFANSKTNGNMNGDN